MQIQVHHSIDGFDELNEYNAFLHVKRLPLVDYCQVVVA